MDEEEKKENTVPSNSSEKVEIKEGESLPSEPQGAEEKGESDEIQVLRAKVESYESALKDYEEKWLRTIAEFDNFRKRTEREKEQFMEYALEGFIKDFLPVIDGLEKACEALGEDGKSLSEGLRLIYNLSLGILSKYGVKQIEALGKEFDPFYHEAISRLPSKEHKPGTIVQEVQKGYMLKSRVIRPSLVVVAVEEKEEEEKKKEEEKKEEEKDGQGGGD